MSINIDNLIPIPKVISTNLPQWATLIGKLDCYSEILNQEILPAFVESKVQILETNSLEYAAKLGNIHPIRNKIEEFSTCSRHKVVSVLTVDNIPISFGFTNSLLNGNNCSTLAKFTTNWGWMMNTIVITYTQKFEILKIMQNRWQLLVPMRK